MDTVSQIGDSWLRAAVLINTSSPDKAIEFIRSNPSTLDYVQLVLPPGFNEEDAEKWTGSLLSVADNSGSLAVSVFILKSSSLDQFFNILGFRGFGREISVESFRFIAKKFRDFLATNENEMEGQSIRTALVGFPFVHQSTRMLDILMDLGILSESGTTFMSLYVGTNTPFGKYSLAQIGAHLGTPHMLAHLAKKDGFDASKIGTGTEGISLNRLDSAPVLYVPPETRDTVELTRILLLHPTFNAMDEVVDGLNFFEWAESDRPELPSRLYRSYAKKRLFDIAVGLRSFDLPILQLLSIYNEEALGVGYFRYIPNRADSWNLARLVKHLE